MGYPSNEPDAAPAAEQLLDIVERYERLDEAKRDIAGDQKEVMAEAKGLGYDTKVLKKIIALRKRDPDSVAEEASLIEIYKAALGMP
jgi:uncharacterized protein (UPF0335 family)